MVCVVCLVMFCMNVKSEAVLTEMQEYIPQRQKSPCFCFSDRHICVFRLWYFKNSSKVPKEVNGQSEPGLLGIISNFGL